MAGTLSRGGIEENSWSEEAGCSRPRAPENHRWHERGSCWSLQLQETGEQEQKRKRWRRRRKWLFRFVNFAVSFNFSELKTIHGYDFRFDLSSKTLIPGFCFDNFSFNLKNFWIHDEVRCDWFFPMIFVSPTTHFFFHPKLERRVPQNFLKKTKFSPQPLYIFSVEFF